MPLMKVIVRWFDKNLELTIMIIAYGMMSSILFVEVVRRFLFRVQTSWGAEVAIHLFIWMCWFGCAYGIKERSHLNFPAIRARLSDKIKFILCLMDNLLWLMLAAVIFYGSIKTIIVLHNWGSIIQGTDFFPQWISFSGIPLAFTAICVRILQDSVRRISNYRLRETLKISE